MNRNAYKLANSLHMGSEIRGMDNRTGLSEKEFSKYRKAFRKKARANTRKPYIRYMAAACMAATLLGSAVFSGDVHAAIEHMSWSISSALGLPGSLEKYREVVNSSVHDQGYVFTLQEVVATEEKLVINYTVAREDGLSLGEIPPVPDGMLYINGRAIRGAASGGSVFLDEAQTILGVDMSYQIQGIDMAAENTYQIKFSNVGMGIDVKGKWEFQFVADATELLADTRRIPVEKTIEIQDGMTVTLKELSMNELEQRISYSMQGTSDYILQVIAEDDRGHQVEFSTSVFYGDIGEGHMINQEILYDGRIDENADTVKLTVYVHKLPEESGKMGDDYQQIGEAFELNLR